MGQSNEKMLELLERARRRPDPLIKLEILEGEFKAPPAEVWKLLQDEIQQSRKLIDQLKERVKSLEGQRSGLAKSLADMEKALTRSGERIHEYQNLSINQEEKIADLQEKIDRYEGKGDLPWLSWTAWRLRWARWRLRRKKKVGHLRTQLVTVEALIRERRAGEGALSRTDEGDQP